jgi:hypothetical protein
VRLQVDGQLKPASRQGDVVWCTSIRLPLDGGYTSATVAIMIA